jgi:GNAT superfamily N-acetyltransferase
MTYLMMRRAAGSLLPVIELHVLTPDDWTAWRDLRLAALADAPYAFASQLSDWQGVGEERWRARLKVPGSHNIVAVLDDQRVGMASGMPTAEAGVVELTSMWVSPTARGRGVGDHLVSAVELWARRSGVSVLKLGVLPGNEFAADLYHRNGFVETGEMGGSDAARRERLMTRAIHSD